MIQFNEQLQKKEKYIMQAVINKY